MSEPRGLRLPRGRSLVLGFVGLLATLLLLRWGVALYVDHLWYRAEDALVVFWTRVLWEGGARVLTGGLTALVVGASLRPVARTFASLQIRRKFGDLVIQERLPAAYLRWAVLGLAALAGFWFAAALPSGTGLQLLLALRGPETGTVDPLLNADLAFYLFRLPFLTGLLTWSMVLVIFTAAIVAAGYAGSAALRFGQGKVEADPLVTRHMAGLLAAFLLLVSLRLLLSPYLLLADGTSSVQGIVGAADVGARIPALRLTSFLAFVTASAAAWGSLRSRILPGLAGTGAVAVLAVLLLQVYPGFVQRFQVQPNELVRETPHIERAVTATREGFSLGSMDRVRLPYRVPDAPDWVRAEERLSRLPVWTPKTLEETFQEVEARFRYYRFAGVTFTRYPSPERPGESTPVALGVREILPDSIPDRTWQNLHLRERFVTGQGAVAGPLHRQDPQGRMPTWLGALPPEFRAGSEVPPDLRLERPQVHVGASGQLYSIVTPGPDAFLAPDGTTGVPGVDFPRGIAAGSLLRRAALAWHFQDVNILISDEVGPDSRIQHRRDVASRIRALAPFLHLPEAPYAVIQDGRIVWIMEGFTVSRRYPLAVAHAVALRAEANYVRNAVKATVDAVTGETRLYAADPSDPLLAGWSRAFPGLIRPLEEMPGELRDHLRYSRWLMELQVRVLLRYHQEAPPVFHGQQDPWGVPVEIPDASGAVLYRPEYALLTLPGDSRESWALSTVFIPDGRRNLAAFLAGTWSDGGSRLTLWDVPQEDQVAGPPQVAALVEQDAAISEQFSLWRRGGSDVSTGHLHLVPVGETLLYMSPVFLAAASNPIPEIRRYIVSDGRRVAMEPTLSGAVRALRGGSSDDAEIPLDPETGMPDVFTPSATGTLTDARFPGADEALRILEEAEGRLRDGDWEGFGRALDALRELLRRQAGGSPPG